MHHADAAQCAQLDLGPGQLGHVHRDQAVVDQAQPVHARERALAVLFLRLRDFLRGLVQVQVHRHVELVGEHADALEVGVRHGVRRMRRERGRHQRVVAPLVVDLAGLVEVFVVALGPGGGEIDHRQADPRAEAVALVGRGLHVREEVVLVAAGGTAAQHLGDRQFDAVGDETGRNHACLDRPDVVLQPGLERQVVGDPAQQGHRVVAVGVDQAGDEHAIGARHGFSRAEPLARLGHRQHRDDGAVADGHRVVFEHHPMRFDRNDPTGLDEQVAGGGLAAHHLT